MIYSALEGAVDDFRLQVDAWRSQGEGYYITLHKMTTIQTVAEHLELMVGSGTSLWRVVYDANESNP